MMRVQLEFIKGSAHLYGAIYSIGLAIDDPDISDIVIYDAGRIYIKKLGIRYKADIVFKDESDYERFC